MPKKRIAFVANTSWSIYKFRLFLIKRLIDKGFALYVLAPRDAHTIHFEKIPGLTYIELFQFHSKTLSVMQDLRLLRELAAHYRQIRPDCIFHYTIKANIWGSIAAGRAEIPSISVITGLGYAFAGGGWLQASAKILYRWALAKNRETWFLNDDDRQVFLRRKLVRSSKTFILPGEGVDTGAFYPVTTDRVHQRLTFLLIARIIEHKGIREFVQAASLLREKGLAVNLQLLGFFDEGNPVAISQQEVLDWQAKGLINYLGDTDDVSHYIAAADCIVLPSYREGMPLSLLEGASMARALIATDVPGCRQLIRNGINGYLCAKKNGADLAQKMMQFYALPPETRRQMGERGRDFVLQHFTQEIIADIYLQKIALFLGDNQH